MVDKGGAEPPLDAQHAFAGAVVRVVLHCHDFIIAADLHIDAAAHAAVGAGGGDALLNLHFRLFYCDYRGDGRLTFESDGLGDGGLGLDGAGGADGQALAAGGADGLGQGLVHEGADAAAAARPQEIYSPDELVLFLAGVDAAGAEDAGLHADAEYRVAGVRCFTGPGLPAGAVNAVVTGGPGQLPVLALATDEGSNGRLGRTIGREHCQSQLQHAGADSFHLGGVSADRHAFAGGDGTGGGKAAHTFNLHQAGAAGPNGLHVRVLAKLGQVGIGGVDGVQDGGPLRHLDLLAIYGQGDGHDGGTPSPFTLRPRIT